MDSNLFTPLIDLVFPRRCLACREFLGKHRDDLCLACAATWLSLDPPYCERCAQPFDSPQGISHLCGECLTEEKFCRRVFAAGLYSGLLHDLIVRLKYRYEERLASYLGRRMAETMEGDYDLILPVPLYRSRLRERGFNQALLLAREVAKKIRVEVDPFLLTKHRSTLPQAALRGEERRKNLKNAFALSESGKVKDKKLLLVDDVYTTGATLEAVSEVLLEAGASEVEGLVLARAV